jgi:hypothetical protein
MAKTKAKRVPGDTFILCTFPLLGTVGPVVLESGDDLSRVCAEIPNHLECAEEDGERLSVCRVAYWIASPSDPTDATPRGLKTIFECEPYDTDAIEDEDEPAPAEATS